MMDETEKSPGTLAVPDDDRKFEVSLRLMGNEMIAIALFSNSPSSKWIWMSLGAVAALLIGFTVFGSDLAGIYRSFVP